MTMPEEVNRIVTDRLSNLLLATSPDAIAHLAHEGVAAERIPLVGNPMIDTLLSFVKDSGEGTQVQGFEIQAGPVEVETLEHQAPVDDPGTLTEPKDGRPPTT